MIILVILPVRVHVTMLNQDSQACCKNKDKPADDKYICIDCLDRVHPESLINTGDTDINQTTNYICGGCYNIALQEKEEEHEVQEVLASCKPKTKI